jgi:hypothetical protein
MMVIPLRAYRTWWWLVQSFHCGLTVHDDGYSTAGLPYLVIVSPVFPLRAYRTWWWLFQNLVLCTKLDIHKLIAMFCSKINKIILKLICLTYFSSTMLYLHTLSNHVDQTTPY